MALCCCRKNDDDKHSIANTLRHARDLEVAEEDDTAGSLVMLMGYSASTINCVVQCLWQKVNKFGCRCTQY